MKTVYESSMVAHVWAHERQDHARNPQGNVSFRGNDFYSYNTVIARRVKTPRGVAILISRNNYSPTTARHLCHLRRSCAHLTCFWVSQVERLKKPGEYFGEYKERVKDLTLQFGRSRTKKSFILDQLRKVAEEANAFAAFFKLKSRIKLPDAENFERLAAESAAKERERQQRLNAKRLAETAEARAKWLAGEGNYYPYVVDEPIHLRVIGENVQTSRGAVVPLPDAVRLFKVVQRCRETHTGFTPNGEQIQVGHFNVNRIDSEGNAVVGCHHLQYEEMLRLATLLNVA